MSAFLLGLAAGALAVPAAAAVTVGLLLAARALAGTTARLTSRSHPEARAATAAVLFGARRARVWSFGNTAVAFVVGLDHDARKDAYDRLRPAARTAAPLRVLRRPQPRLSDPGRDDQ